MAPAVEPKPKARILSAYTLCDADCERGFHNPASKTCDRCGASIHVRIFEVETASGEQLTVGRECLRDVLGYIPGPWHQRAEAVAARLRQLPWLRMGHRVRAYGLSGKLAVIDTGSSERIIRVPHRLSPTLLRAGADLGVWTYPMEERAIWGRGLYYWVEWIG